MFIAWIVLCLRRQFKTLRPIGWVAFGLATANALVGAFVVAYGDLLLPSWRNPTILFFLAPLAMLLGVVAAVDGAPKWLMALVELASVPILVLGLFAVAAV
jgi:hypothetical protein